MTSPNLTYPAINWKDGMKLTEQHFIAQDKHLHDLIRDGAWTSLHAHNYGLLQAAKNDELQLNLFGEDVVVSACKALTADGNRIHLTSAHTPLKRSILDIPADGAGRRDAEYFVTLTIDVFNPITTGEPDSRQSPVRYPYVMPRLGLTFLKKADLAAEAPGQALLAIGKLRIEANSYQLDTQYIPPCTRLKAHTGLMAFHQQQGASLGQIVEKVVLVSKNGQKQDAPNSAKDLVVANSIVKITTGLLNALAATYDSYQLLLPELPPVQLVLFFKQVARLLHYCLRSLPDADREQLFNYIRTNATMDRDYAYYSNAIEQVLSIDYQHNDIRVALRPIEHFVQVLLMLFDKMVGLEFLKTTGGKGPSLIWEKL